LSRQQVVVGRASTKVGAPLIRLGWTDQPSSYATGTDRLTAEEVGTEPIDYFAGTEFRLLGTYNALDAQRVFRFGLALGRRFAQVPIPPADPTDFEAMLETPAAEIDDLMVRAQVTAQIAAMYRAHYQSSGARLGPAMFLSIPDYVAKGLELTDVSGADASSSDDVSSLVMEAYLLATGSWLARLDEHTELPGLASALTTATIDTVGNEMPPALSSAHWDWITAQLSTIGG
jgi:hypothetical protein